MVLKINVNHRTHYDLLGVKEDDSYEEIRTAYRSLILRHHPDKLQNRSETSNLHYDSGSGFLEVQKAWEILCNPMSRAIYDNELRSLRQDASTSEDVGLEDMSIEEVGAVLELFYHCRCGDYFSIDSSELAEMGYPLLENGNQICLQRPEFSPASVIIPCGSCSLKLGLLIKAETRIVLPIPK